MIGPTTAETARGLGFSVIGVAEPSTAEGLVAVLESSLGPAPVGP